MLLETSPEVTGGCSGRGPNLRRTLVSNHRHAGDAAYLAKVCRRVLCLTQKPAHTICLDAVWGCAPIKLPAGWQAYALFLGFPLWWVLGVQNFIWPVLSLPLLLSLLWRGSLRVPPGFGIWVIFLTWVATSAIRVEGDWGWLAFLYRGLLYLSATVLFLYIYNVPRQALPDRALINALAAYWVMVALGGFLGLFFPDVSFRSLAAMVVPGELLHNQFIGAMVQPGLADVQQVLDHSLPRPKMFFAHTTAWGASFALLTPFVLAVVGHMKSGLGRAVLVALLVSSIVPFVFSLNRAAWLSLGLGLAYAAARFALRGSVRTPAALLLLFVAIGVYLFYTPVGEIAADRMAHPHSNASKVSVYQEAAERSRQALVLGFGTPPPSEENPDSPVVGRYGQIPLLLFSHGIPGLALFLGWFLYTFVRSGIGGSHVRLWAHVVVIIALLQAPYYELLPMQLHIVMAAAALAWREMVPPSSTRIT